MKKHIIQIRKKKRKKRVVGCSGPFVKYFTRTASVMRKIDASS